MSYKNQSSVLGRAMTNLVMAGLRSGGLMAKRNKVWYAALIIENQGFRDHEDPYERFSIRPVLFTEVAGAIERFNAGSEEARGGPGRVAVEVITFGRHPDVDRECFIQRALAALLAAPDAGTPAWDRAATLQYLAAKMFFAGVMHARRTGR